MSPRSPRFVRAAVLAAAGLLLGLVVPGAVSPAGAAATVTLTGYGADSCAAPSAAQMSAFWENTPFSYWGVYIGGADRGCAQPNLTSAWVSQMVATGWDLLPIWVGPQSPCVPGQAAYFSTNTSTAYAQGKAEALAAYKAWSALSTVTAVPIDYDMEASGTDTTTCRNAKKSFIDGWTAQLHVAPAQQAGVYSSSCAGHIDDYATIANKPDFIDAADWDSSPSTGGISCVASTHWTNHQRHKQYVGGHNATYNGVTLNIDSRCSDGPVYGAASRVSTTQSCARTAASAATARAAAAAAAPVSWHGTLWQAGGPQDAQLQRATGADWQPVRVGSLPLLTHEVPASAAVVGRPVVQGNGSLLVPVTEHDGGRAVQALYTTRDGTHFVRQASIALPGAPAPGVTVPTTVLSGGRVLVLDPDARGGTIWRAGHAARLAVHGLPAGAQVLPGTGDVLTALADTATCRGKAGCVESPAVYRSADGGRSWGG